MVEEFGILERDSLQLLVAKAKDTRGTLCVAQQRHMVCIAPIQNRVFHIELLQVLASLEILPAQKR
jgi:hypothetical protein